MGCLSSKLSPTGKFDKRAKSSQNGRLEKFRTGVDDNARPAELDARFTAATKRRSTLSVFGKRHTASERSSRAGTLGRNSNAATLVTSQSTEIHASSNDLPTREDGQTASLSMGRIRETSDSLISEQLVDHPEDHDQPTLEPAQLSEMEISRATDSGFRTVGNAEQKTSEEIHYESTSQEVFVPRKKRTSPGKNQTHPDSSHRPQPLNPVRYSDHRRQQSQLPNHPREGQSNKPAPTHTPSSFSFPKSSPTYTLTTEYYTPNSSSADLSSDSTTTNHPLQQNVGQPTSIKQSQKPPSRTPARYSDATHIPSRDRLGSYSSDSSLSNDIAPHHQHSHSSSMTTTPHDSSDCVNTFMFRRDSRASRPGGRKSLSTQRTNDKRSGYRASRNRRRHQDNPLGHFPMQGVSNVFNMAAGSTFSGTVNHASQDFRFERSSGRIELAAVVPSYRVGHVVKREKRRR